MTDLFAGRSTDYDGSGAVQVATGPIITTLSGDLGAKQRHPVLNLYSRSDSADYVMTHQQVQLGREQVQLAPGDEFYFTVTAVEPDASIDLSFAVMSTGGGGVDQVARDAAAANAAEIDELQGTGPTLQVLKDSGRYTAVEPYVVGTSQPFSTEHFITSNGRLEEIAAHKFTHNNSTNGGTGDAIDPLVQSLLVRMGRSSSTLKFGTEFYVAERRMLASPSASSSVVVNGQTYYLISGGAQLTGPDKFATVAQWVWAENAGEIVAVKRPAGQLWVNEVESASNTVLPAGWSHVCATDTASLGYVSAMGRICGLPLARFAQALPVVSRNNRQILEHSAPFIFN